MLHLSECFETISLKLTTAAQNTMLKTIKEIDGLTPLKIPVPPMLATAMAYPGNTRFVSFHWKHREVEVEYFDGRMRAEASYSPYFDYIQHPTVKPSLKAYNLGYPHQREATHALILDRLKLKVYIAPVKAAETFLKQQPHQSPTQPLVRMIQQDSSAISTNALHAAVNRRIAAHHAVINEMRLWLDRYLKK
jgi:hypothetical protein